MSKNNRIELYIDSDGSIRCVHSDEIVGTLKIPGDLEISRASNVEPIQNTGQWRISYIMLDGCTIEVFPFSRRDAAIEFEVKMVNAQLAGFDVLEFANRNVPIGKHVIKINKA